LGTQETRLREGGHIIQQREIRKETSTPSNKGNQEQIWHKLGDKRDKLGDKLGEGKQGLGKVDTPSNKEKQEGREDLRKADTPSNKAKQERRQAEDKGDKPSGRRTHHPTNKNKEDKLGELGEGRQSLGKAETPSNKGN